MRALLLAALLAAPVPALAHTGADHAHGLGAGFLHPFTGLDHLVAMVAVGLWAGLLGGRGRLAVPAGFLGGMAAGGVFGMAGLGLPMVEAGIIASVILGGALVAAAARLPVLLATVLAAVFGVLHGHAHGVELGGSGLAHVPGMLAATALLLGAGVLVAGWGVRRGREVPVRLAGGACAAMALFALLPG